MKETPARMHNFIRKIAAWSFSDNIEIKKKLYDVMIWPTNHEKLKIYGKTGSWGNAVWFNGFGTYNNGTWKAVTVFINGNYRNRDRAIKYFYERFNLKYIDSGINN
jgi:hypothetical protein